MQYKKSLFMLHTIIYIIQLLAGIALSGFFGLAFVIFLFDAGKNSQASDLIMCLVLLIFGVLLLYFGVKRRKLMTLCKNYSARLSRDALHSLDNLASSMNRSTAQVTADMDRLIMKGFFPGVYINRTTNRIESPSWTGQTATVSAPSQPPQRPAAGNGSAPAYIEVTCRNCGASNRIQKGSVSECEFCGSPVSGER